MEPSMTIEPIKTHDSEINGLKTITTLGNVRYRHEHTNEIILIPAPSDDPNDPLNWSKGMKYYMATIICTAMFMCNFLAAGPTIAIVETALDFFPTASMSGTSGVNAAISKTAYFFTTTALLQGVGNFFWMPLVNKYGRRPVYIASYAIYVVTAIWLSVTTSYKSFLAARIIMGFAAGSAETMAPVSIADVFFLHERGKVMAMYNSALSCGVAGGDIIDGLITINHPWRMIYYVSIALISTVLLLAIFTFPETAYIREIPASSATLQNSPVKDNGESSISYVETAGQASIPSKKTYLQSLKIFSGTYTKESLWSIFIRPIALIFLPAVLWGSLVMSVTIGFLVAMTSNVAPAYSTAYGFASWQTGLCFISAVIGSLVGIYMGGHIGDMVADYFTKRNGGIREPEMRLPAIVISLITTPLALILFGAGIQYKLHWMCPTIGLGLLNFSIVQATNISLVYTIDAYRPIAGEITVTTLALKYTSEKPYSCNGCLKSFSRPDLLKRHAQGHISNVTAQIGDNPRSIRVSRACKGCTTAKLKCKEEKPCHRCQRKGIPCESVERGSELASLSQQSSNSTYDFLQQDNSHIQPEDYQSHSPVVLNVDSAVEHHMDTVENGPHMQIDERTHERSQVDHGINDFGMVPPSNSIDVSNPFLEYDNTLAEFLNDVMAPSIMNPYNGSSQQGTATPLGAYRDLLDFGLEENMELDDRDYGMMDYYQGKSLTRPAASISIGQQSPMLELTTFNSGDPATIPLDRTALGIEAFRKSLWCWTPAWYDNGLQDQYNFALQPDDMTNLQTQSTAGLQVVNKKLGTEARDKLVAMVLSTCDRSNFPKIMSSFPTAKLLENLMHSFLASHLAQSDTWIHLPTLQIDDQRAELVGSIVSAGALLSTSLTIRKLGFAIHESVRLSLPKTFEGNNSLTRELGLLQAFVLNLDVGLWSGNKRKIELAESFSSVVITMFRRASRFLRSTYPTIIPLATDEGAELENKWRTWVQQESFKRLVFHLFIRDAQTSISLLVNTSISYAELSLTLPECRKLWLAKNASDWKAISLSKKLQSFDRIPSLQQCIHDTSHVTNAQEWIDLELSTSIILYAIWGLVVEYTRLSSIQKAYPPPQIYSGVLIIGHRHQELCNLLHNLSVSSGEWRSTAGMTPTAKILHALLLMHLHVSFNDLQLFAGKEGEDEARRVYPSLQQWVINRDARQAVWYAGQIIKAAKQLKTHQMRDFNAVAVYHASLAFWAYGVLSINSGHKVSSTMEGDADQLVWLDGTETAATKMFITLQRGVPCFSRLGSDSGGEYEPGVVARLSDPGEVMMIILKILRGHSGRIEQSDSTFPPLPPLLENLSQLMRELGAAAKAMMGRV